MMATAGTFETKVTEHLRKHGTVRIRGERQYHLDDIWCTPARGGRTLRVSFRLVPVPVDEDAPPAPYEDLTRIYHPTIHQGTPAGEKRSRFAVDLPPLGTEGEAVVADAERFEHHGERTYHFTFTDARSVDENWTRFQAFLDATVVSPEEIKEANRHAWQTIFNEVRKSRKHVDSPLSLALGDERERLSQHSRTNFRTARQYLLAYYILVYSAFSIFGLSLLLDLRHYLVDQWTLRWATLGFGTVCTLFGPVILKRCVTRAQRDFTIALFYREGTRQLSKPDQADPDAFPTRIAANPVDLDPDKAAVPAMAGFSVFDSVDSAAVDMILESRPEDPLARTRREIQEGICLAQIPVSWGWPGWAATATAFPHIEHGFAWPLADRRP